MNLNLKNIIIYKVSTKLKFIIKIVTRFKLGTGSKSNIEIL